MAEAAHPDFETRFCRPMNPLGISVDFNSYIFGMFFGRNTKASPALAHFPSALLFPEAFPFNGPYVFRDPLPAWDGIEEPVPVPEPPIADYLADFSDGDGLPLAGTVLWFPARVIYAPLESSDSYPGGIPEGKCALILEDAYVVTPPGIVVYPAIFLLSDDIRSAVFYHGAYFESPEGEQTAQFKITGAEVMKSFLKSGVISEVSHPALFDKPFFKMGEHHIPRFGAFPTVHDNYGDMVQHYTDEDAAPEQDLPFIPSLTPEGEVTDYIYEDDINALYRDKYRTAYGFSWLTQEQLDETDPAPSAEDLLTHSMVTHKAQCPHDAIAGVAESIQNARHDVVFRFGALANTSLPGGCNVVVKWECQLDYLYTREGDKEEHTLIAMYQYEGETLEEWMVTENASFIEYFSANDPVKVYHEIFDTYETRYPMGGGVDFVTTYKKAYVKCGQLPSDLARRGNTEGQRAAALALARDSVLEVHTSGQTFDVQGFWWRAEPPGTYA